MDFEIGSGPKNLTTEGIFQIRLGSGSFTVGTGISTSLPFSTVLSLPFSTISDTISPTTSHASATPGPSTSASRGSLQFTSTNTSRPAFDNNYWNTGKSLSRPSGTVSTPSLMLNTSYRTSQSLTQTSSPAGPGRVNLTSLDVITPILTTSLGKLSTAGAGESTHTISNVSLYASPTVIPKSGTDGTGQATLPIANASTRTSRMSQSKPSVTGSIRPSLLLISSTGVCYTGSCHHTSNASLHTPTASMTRSNTPPQSVGSLGNLFGNSYGLSGRQSISTSESIATGGATVNSTSLGSSTGLVSVSSSLSKSSYPSATISSSSTVFQTSSTSSASLLPVPTSTPIPTTSSDSASGVFTTVWISSTIQSSVGVTTKGHTTRDAGSNGTYNVAFLFPDLLQIGIRNFPPGFQSQLNEPGSSY